MNNLQLFRFAQKLPLGTRLFSIALNQIAPYFGSIRAHVEQLEPNYARVSLKNRRSVQNHLQTVHAIAMCNMAELAGGLLTDVSIPRGSRWIPSGMTVRYLKKAKTDLVAEAKTIDIDWSQASDVMVPIEVRDVNKQLVFTAQITMNIKHKKR
ncbi:hotdog fold domain-containing protein [Agitococcus lubricus]|uniref:Acyl-coenzyme A thioesterase PaaI-like protein n=1 Tax=Agitococcus lubricus TaxID=1077255 RepID=A0A2T5IVQ9_9GAMM|nr:hotdog fold domain-containing protein [Agitococcus lubricus]PTQ87982.1 acyl-coenzyme A thioesterase PaaI-like protein [Agitococcus lubricus]